MEKSKLYLCLSDDGKLSLQTRVEVDEWLKSVEETLGAFNQTVIGSIELPNDIPYFFIVFMNGQKTTTYDLVQAQTEEEAKGKVLSKKRNQGKKISFKRVLNIEDIIKSI